MSAERPERLWLEDDQWIVMSEDNALEVLDFAEDVITGHTQPWQEPYPAYHTYYGDLGVGDAAVMIDGAVVVMTRAEFDAKHPEPTRMVDGRPQWRVDGYTITKDSNE